MTYLVYKFVSFTERQKAWFKNCCINEIEFVTLAELVPSWHLNTIEIEHSTIFREYES